MRDDGQPGQSANVWSQTEVIGTRFHGLVMRSRHSESDLRECSRIRADYWRMTSKQEVILR
jgi:hypothetical protein